MASEKQLKANRENAKRSTGPKTAAGRLRSSRNALRHGLSCPLTTDPVAAIAARQLAQVLLPEAADDSQTMAAIQMAEAQAQLLRVAAARRTLMANLEFASANLNEVWRLAALDRYERQALTRRHRAARMLAAGSHRNSGR